MFIFFSTGQVSCWWSQLCYIHYYILECKQKLNFSSEFYKSQSTWTHLFITSFLQNMKSLFLYLPSDEGLPDLQIHRAQWSRAASNLHPSHTHLFPLLENPSERSHGQKSLPQIFLWVATFPFCSLKSRVKCKGQSKTEAKIGVSVFKD